jgi:hypothetical protein
MVNKSTNINKTNNASHLHSLNTKRGTTTYNIEYQGPGFRQAHKLDGVKTYIKYIFIEM